LPFCRVESVQQELVAAYVKLIGLDDFFDYNTVDPLLDPTLLSVNTMIMMHLFLQRQQFMKLFDKLSPGKSSNNAYTKAYRLAKLNKQIEWTRNSKNPKYCTKEVDIWLASPYATAPPNRNRTCPCCHR